MEGNNLFFLENLEWFDESGQELVHRLPEEGSVEGRQERQLQWSELRRDVGCYWSAENRWTYCSGAVS